MCALRRSAISCTAWKALVTEYSDEPGAAILDPQMSRDGRHVAFVRDAELYVVPVAGGAPARAPRSGAG